MRNSLAKSALFNAIYQGLNVVFPLISATYVAKILSPNGVGEVAYAQNIVSYFVIIAALGMPTYGTREIAKKWGHQSQLNTLFSELFVINAISTGICMAVYAGIVAFMPAGGRLLYIICGLELLFNFINVDWFYRGKEDFVYIAVRSVTVKTISLCLLFLFVKDQGDCAVYALLVCLANGCNYLFNILRLHKDVQFTTRNLNLKQHMKALLTLLICSVAASLYSKIDITMLGVFCTKSSVGLYSTAFKTVNIALAVVASVTSVFLPRISYCYQNDRTQFTMYVSKGVQMVMLIAVPAMIGIAMVSRDLMTLLFGNEYTVAYSIVAILAPLLLIKGFGDILCYQVLVSAGKEKHFLFSYVMAAAANIILNALLIPRFDYNGAAVASVASELLVNLMLLRYSMKVVKPEVGRRSVISVSAATAAMMVSVLAVQNVLSSLVGRLFCSVAVGVMCYLVVNILLKNDMVYLVINKMCSKLKAKHQ